MEAKNIEQLFKNEFSNFEADVNPNAWTSIQHGLQSPVPMQEVAGNAASGGKAIGLWGYAGLFVAATAVVITAWIYYTDIKSPDEIASVTHSAPAIAGDVKAENSFEPIVLSEISPAVVKNSSVEKHSADNTVKQELVPAVQEKNETVPEEIKNSDNTPAAVTPVVSDNTENTVTENTVEPKTVVTESNSVPITKDAPVISINTQSSSLDFDFVNEPIDNGAPREQESRSDFTFYIPTVFTPNGDRVNDDFKPMGLNFRDYELVIYDGKSSEIFRSKDIEHKWDGKLKDGTLASAGVYVYVISVKDLNNVEHPQRGQLLLKR
ncbi:MAG TPA: gliding motility-associated C-terminal domain-containing protein [Bacteroidia bacterium]|nr:gliding motility-associated C-terminal domain-containing protein [Bacteroidia bacterium]